jgi:hypothetical protein
MNLNRQLEVSAVSALGFFVAALGEMKRKQPILA